MEKSWTFDEISAIFHLPLLDLVYKAAEQHRRFFNPREIQICHLISIKTGGCPEDCKYCAQSARYRTSIQAIPPMTKAEIIAKAKAAGQAGATRVCLGIAQREIRDNHYFEQLLEVVETLTAIGLEVCVTAGMLSIEQAKRLEKAGLYAYNHNLDTSEQFYPKIITTRTYEDRLNTIDILQKTNIQVCCGGIIGLGEAQEDRIEFLKTLANLNPYPGSVPINLLHPVEGTPLANEKPPPPWEIVRMIATARLCMPKATVRLTAGRLFLSKEMQAFCFLAGANSIFVGEKLLTVGNPTLDADEELLHELGLIKKT